MIILLLETEEVYCPGTTSILDSTELVEKHRMELMLRQFPITRREEFRLLNYTTAEISWRVNNCIPILLTLLISRTKEGPIT